MANLAGAERQYPFCIKGIAVGKALDFVLCISAFGNNQREAICGSHVIYPCGRSLVPNARCGELWTTTARKRGRHTDMSNLSGCKQVAGGFVVEE